VSNNIYLLCSLAVSGDDDDEDGDSDESDEEDNGDVSLSEVSPSSCQENKN